MLRYAAVYGGISGGIIIGVMTVCFYLSGNKGMATSMWLGYLVMILTLSLIFIGMKRYRDKEKGGVISFWPALSGASGGDRKHGGVRQKLRQPVFPHSRLVP
ncbi:MAG: DUF4199 domain-containing protein [Amphiplicatus sp.]